MAANIERLKEAVIDSGFKLFDARHECDRADKTFNALCIAASKAGFAYECAMAIKSQETDIIHCPSACECKDASDAQKILDDNNITSHVIQEITPGLMGYRLVPKKA